MLKNHPVREYIASGGTDRLRISEASCHTGSGFEKEAVVENFIHSCNSKAEIIHATPTGIVVEAHDDVVNKELDLVQEPELVNIFRSRAMQPQE